MKSPRHVLFVDDEESLRILVRAQLSDEGYDVDVAGDGDEALERLGKSPYDVVILDVRMPRMNGIEVLKHIQAKRGKPRIIMLTAVDDLTIAIEAVKNGANEYLTKPFEMKTLVGCIEKVAAG